MKPRKDQPSPNGQLAGGSTDAPPQPRPRRKPGPKPTPTPTPDPVPPDPVPPDPVEFRPGNARARPGRLAHTIQRRPVEWFLPDLIPQECLTFLIGTPGAGKSTCGAWLCSRAKRPAILPGCEESVEVSLVPRLAANGVALERCLILDGRLWSMPHDRQALTDVLQRHRADLLWIDPVDTYVQECGENEGQGVRAALEALARIAVDVPCTVVCARHPGKDPRNLCPGSRQWRAVPRVILQITLDDGPPVRRYLRMVRDPFGGDVGPREVHLDGFGRMPRTFRLGDLASASAVETSSISDVIDRTMIDAATDLLTALLAGGEQESKAIYKHAEEERLKDRTVRLAARRLGVIVRREGVGLEHRAYWSLPHSGTPAKTHSDTPKPKSRRRQKGVTVPDCQTAGVPDSPGNKGVVDET